MTAEPDPKVLRAVCIMCEGILTGDTARLCQNPECVLYQGDKETAPRRDEDK